MSKRKRYRPRPVINTLSLLQRADHAQTRRLSLLFLSSLQAIAADRHPGVDEWRNLADAVNTVETLCLHMRKLSIDEVMPSVRAASDAMVAAALRFKRGGPMRVDGPGLEALRSVIDIYIQCLEGLTAREMAQAQAETQRRVNELLHAPDAQVVDL